MICCGLLHFKGLSRLKLNQTVIIILNDRYPFGNDITSQFIGPSKGELGFEFGEQFICIRLYAIGQVKLRVNDGDLGFSQLGVLLFMFLEPDDNGVLVFFQNISSAIEGLPNISVKFWGQLGKLKVNESLHDIQLALIFRILFDIDVLLGDVKQSKFWEKHIFDGKELKKGP